MTETTTDGGVERNQRSAVSRETKIAAIFAACVIGGGTYLWQQAEFRAAESVWKGQYENLLGRTCPSNTTAGIDESANKEELSGPSVQISEQTDETSEPDKKTEYLRTQEPLIKTSRFERFVYYEGSVVVSGTYRELKPGGLMGGELCFAADDATGYLIPRDPALWGEGNGDDRAPWFCFENSDEAKAAFNLKEDEMFGKEGVECVKGNAVVEISNYVVDTLEASVFDTAKLVRVISAEKYSLGCQ